MNDNPWEEDTDYPMADWRMEVLNGDTLRGYWDWVSELKEDQRLADQLTLDI